ncbi:MAG: TRAP transporter substrate-binding protein DctP [Propionivibrio sp.]
MRLLNRLLSAACAITFTLFVGTASAQTVIKAGHGAQAGHPTQFGLLKFAEIVTAKSGGKLKIEVYPDRQLGEEREMIEGLQLGTVDMAVVSTGPLLAFAPKVGVLDLPFLFKNSAHAYKVLDGDVGKSLLKEMEARNLHDL